LSSQNSWSDFSGRNRGSWEQRELGAEGAGSRGSWEQRELGAEGAGSRGSCEQRELGAEGAVSCEQRIGGSRKNTQQMMSKLSRIRGSGGDG
jgi:hypothetical protein